MKYQKALPQFPLEWLREAALPSLKSYKQFTPGSHVKRKCMSFLLCRVLWRLTLFRPSKQRVRGHFQTTERDKWILSQQFLLQPHTATHRDDDSHVLFCLAVKVCSQALKQAFMVCLQALTALSMTANVQTEKVKCLDALMKCHKFCQCRSRLKTVTGLMIRHVVITAVQANRRDSSLLQTSQ